MKPAPSYVRDLPSTPYLGTAPPAAPGTATWEPYDAAFHHALEHSYGRVIDYYFRAEIEGAEHLPTEGPALLVANHSGSCFPHDAMVLDTLVWRRDGRPGIAGKLRTLFEREITLAWWTRFFGIDDFWRRCGGVDTTVTNIDRLLARGTRVLYFPEGADGIAKGFNQRYRLQPFSPTFVKLAARYDAPVVPVHVVGAEWAAPFGYTSRRVNRWVQRWLHIPFFPCPVILLGVFPVLWYFALPCKLRYVVGEPVDVRRWLTEAGASDTASPSRAEAELVAQRLRAGMQAELERQVGKHGHRPFEVQSLGRALWHERHRLLRLLPFGWPQAFLGLERDLHEERSSPRRFRDWDLFAWYVPVLGWPLLALIRRLRRPPFGSRGLSTRAARLHQGEFTWSLKDLPLPLSGEATSKSTVPP